MTKVQHSSNFRSCTNMNAGWLWLKRYSVGDMAADAGPRLRSVPAGPPPSILGDDDEPQIAYNASPSSAATVVRWRLDTRINHMSVVSAR